MSEVTRHFVISGTGRAGTSFLVQFLEACGLDTGDGRWNDRARAGLEHRLRPGAPHVVKDPLLALYCADVDLTATAVEVLVVPMRDLDEAADSRIYLERVASADRALTRITDELVAWTAGGIYGSLERLDVARTLAVIEHRLLLWAVRSQIPIVLLDFPRLVEDADYLIETLWPHLSSHTDRRRAAKAFAETARPEMVKAGRSDDSTDQPRQAVLERNEDLRNRLKRQQRVRKELEADLDAARRRIAELESE